MKNALHPELFAPHFVEPVPDADGMYIVGCIDKNPPDDSVCEVLGGAGPYFQLPGGANYGGAIATAWETSKPGFLKENAQAMVTPVVTTIGKLAAKAMATKGYRKIIHTPCLATTYEQDIAHAAADPTAEMLQRAKQFDPTFRGEAQSRTIQAAGRVLEAVTHVTPREVEAIMTGSQEHAGTRLQPLSMARLRDSHPARAILANYTNQMFDVRAANQAGNQAYCISMGLIPEVSKVFPVQEQYLRHALALNMGIISLHSKVRGADGDLLPIIRIDK